MDDDLDQLLRQALVRVQPSAGFADRVIGTVHRKQVRMWRWTSIAAIAALLIALVTLRFEENRRERYERALETQRQAYFALQLAAKQFTSIDARLRKSALELRIRKEKEHL
jgi:hypothetical protein